MRIAPALCPLTPLAASIRTLEQFACQCGPGAHQVEGLRGRHRGRQRGAGVGQRGVLGGRERALLRGRRRRRGLSMAHRGKCKSYSYPNLTLMTS